MERSPWRYAFAKRFWGLQFAFWYNETGKYCGEQRWAENSAVSAMCPTCTIGLEESSPGRLKHIHTTDKPNCHFSEETEVTYSAPEKRKGKSIQHLSCPSFKICPEDGQAAGEHRRMGDQWSCTPPLKRKWSC